MSLFGWKISFHKSTLSALGTTVFFGKAQIKLQAANWTGRYTKTAKMPYSHLFQKPLFIHDAWH